MFISENFKSGSKKDEPSPCDIVLSIVSWIYLETTGLDDLWYIKNVVVRLCGDHMNPHEWIILASTTMLKARRISETNEGLFCWKKQGKIAATILGHEKSENFTKL